MQLLWLAFKNAGDGSTVDPGALGLLVGETRNDIQQRGKIIQLFRETRMPLYCYLVSMGIRPDQADDVIQDAFVRLHKQLESGTRIENPRGWLFRVAHNLSIDLHRVERRLVPESVMELDEDDVASAGQVRSRVDPQPNPEELYLKSERMKRLDRGMAQLTHQQRQCLHLRAEGLRYREIALVLGISVSSVAEHIQRAIVRLAGEIHA